MRSIFVIALALVTGPFAFGQINGQQLFQVNCTACHTLGGGRLVGPDLKGVTDKYEKEWLINFISSSQSMINSGDERAVAIAQEFNNMPMPDQPFNDEQLTALLGYIMTQSESSAVAAEQPDKITDKTVSNIASQPGTQPKMKMMTRGKSEHSAWVGRLMLLSIIIGFTTAGIILFLTRKR